MTKSSCWETLSALIGISTQKLLLCFFDMLALLGTAMLVFFCARGLWRS